MHAERDRQYERWKKAVGRCRKWTGKDNVRREQRLQRGGCGQVGVVGCVIGRSLPPAKLALSFGSGAVTGAIVGLALYFALR